MNFGSVKLKFSEKKGKSVCVVKKPDLNIYLICLMCVQFSICCRLPGVHLYPNYLLWEIQDIIRICTREKPSVTFIPRLHVALTNRDSTLDKNKKKRNDNLGSF